MRPARRLQLRAVKRSRRAGKLEEYCRCEAVHGPFRSTSSNCRLSFNAKWLNTMRHWQNDLPI